MSELLKSYDNGAGRTCEVRYDTAPTPRSFGGVSPRRSCIGSADAAKTGRPFWVDARAAAASSFGVASRAAEAGDAPLSAEELAAINSLANGGLNQEQISQDAATAASALVDAVANSGKADVIQDITELLKEEEKELNEGDAVENRDNPCRAKNPATCPYHGGFEHPFAGKTGTLKA